MIGISLKMVAYYFRQSMEKKLQWLLVFVLVFCLQIVYHFFYMVDDVVRIFGSLEDEVIPVSRCVEHDIALVKYGIPEGTALYLRAFYVMVIYVDDMPCKDIPVDVHHSEIGYEPYVIIPVKYAVY